MSRVRAGALRRSGLTAFVAGAALMFAPAAMAASSWSVQPTPSQPGTSAALDGVSCPSAAWCAGVGYSTTSAGAYVNLAEISNGTKWTVDSSPTSAGASLTGLNGVDCTAVDVCTAVGRYFNASGAESTLAEARTTSGWSIKTTPNPAGSTGDTLMGVSCWTAGGCIAVGQDKNTAGHDVTLAEKWNGSTWAVTATPNPAGATSSVLNDVACTSATNCVAVGASSGATTQVALAEHWNGTTWSITQVPNPSGATQSLLNGISCVAATACEAVGESTGPSGELTLTEFYNGTTWTVQASPNPAGAEESLLSHVSCTAAKACDAVGQELTSAKAYVTLAEQWNGTAWSVVATPNAAGSVGSSLRGVSCVSATACTATGGDNNSSGTQFTLAEQYAPPPALALSWSAPTELTGVEETAMRATTCISATECVTVGDGGMEATFSPVATAGLHAKKLTTTGVTGVPNFLAVACPSATQCTAMGGQADMVTFNPSTLALIKAKNIEHPSAVAMVDVACASTSLCVAGDEAGYMFAFNPTTGVLSAPKKHFDPNDDAFNGIACASGTQCTAVNQVGIEYTFNPTVSPLPTPTSSTKATIDPNPLEAIACPSATVCVATDEQGTELTFNASSSAAKGTVKSHVLDAGNDLISTSCLSTTLCATIDTGGKVFEGIPNTNTWQSAQIPGFPNTDGIACATTVLCAAVDTSGNLYIGALAPINTAIPAITGTAVSGDTLSSTNGSWTSPYPLTYTRKWERCSATGTSCIAIGGATAVTYKLVAADVGHEITVQVTAGDADHRTAVATAHPTSKVT
jgi:hypothetical protein